MLPGSPQAKDERLWFGLSSENLGGTGTDSDIYYILSDWNIIEPTPTPSVTPMLTFTPTSTPSMTPNETSFTPTPTCFPADLDQDRDVDARDLLDLIRGLNTESDTADLNGDEVTDIKDLFFFGLWWAKEQD